MCFPLCFSLALYFVLAMVVLGPLSIILLNPDNERILYPETISCDYSPHTTEVLYGFRTYLKTIDELIVSVPRGIVG